MEQAPIEKANALLMKVVLQLSIEYKQSLKSARRIRRLIFHAPHPTSLTCWASCHAPDFIAETDPVKMELLQFDRMVVAVLALFLSRVSN